MLIPGLHLWDLDAPEGETDFDTDQLRVPTNLWLKEQYDREERKETWLITMEVSITLLVAAELAMSILDFVCMHSK